MQKNTLANLFNEMGFNPDEMSINEPKDVSDLNYEILSFDLKKQENIFSKITKIVRKDDDEEFLILSSDGDLFYCTGEHKIYVKPKLGQPYFEEIISLIGNQDLYETYTKNGWRKFVLQKTNKKMMVLDVEVENNHCYYSNNILSHNTMYGDPCVSPETSIKIRRKI